MTGQNPSNPWYGRGLIIGAAILWSSSGFFAKAPWFDGWPKADRGVMLAFYRSLFAVLVLVPFIRRPSWNWRLLPMLLSFAVMVWSYMSAMVHGPAANAIWLQYLCPAWVLLFSLLVLRERVRSSDFLMFGLCLSGVGLILAMELGRGGNQWATYMGIVSSFSFAGVVISLRALRELEPAWIISLCHSSTCLVLLPFAWQVEGSVPAISYLALGFFGVFQMSVPYLMFMHGLRSVVGPEASILTLVEPILVPVWVWLAWHWHPAYDAPHWWAWTGGGLILSGLLFKYGSEWQQTRKLVKTR